eukprot:m.277940 g.277940  ORF g.277940 m.277940 type:complete len:86 (+) comp17715_c0_seq2:1711-1968(+)
MLAKGYRHDISMTDASPFDLLPFKELEVLLTYAETALQQDPIVLKILAPVKVFGDIHGQLTVCVLPHACCCNTLTNNVAGPFILL